MGIKQGYKTTEFWSVVGMILSNLVSLFATMNILTSESESAIAQVISATINLISLLVTGQIVVNYTDNRTKLKRQHWNFEQTTVSEFRHEH